MIKTILVGATGSDGDSDIYAAAAAVARPLGAHIDALHVRLDPANVAIAMTTDAGGGALTAGLVDQLERDALAREAKAKQVFDGFFNGGGAASDATWHVEIGEEPRCMAAYGLTADLIIAPRGAGDTEVAARSVLEAVLLESGRPLLIPAAAALPPAFDRVAIAWKPVPQAACAVALAMPFLTRAKEIVVLAVEEEANPDNPADRVAANLARHGLAAKTERLTPGAAGAVATLVNAARERADLLVMGGYGHSRLREWVFGGFTKEVLTAAPLPVLIAH